MHRRRRRSVADVELNVAAMLDMAFQLLTFFILTFRPLPVEGMVEVRLPPARPWAVQPGPATSNAISHVGALVVSVSSEPTGGIGSLTLGDLRMPSLKALTARLETVFADPAAPFDQVILRVGGGLRYDAVMQVVDGCTRLALPNGKRMGRLSFVEVPEGR